VAPPKVVMIILPTITVVVVHTTVYTPPSLVIINIVHGITASTPFSIAVLRLCFTIHQACDHVLTITPDKQSSFTSFFTTGTHKPTTREQSYHCTDGHH
jgi:hypothetical protein